MFLFEKNELLKHVINLKHLNLSKSLYKIQNNIFYKIKFTSCVNYYLKLN